MLNSDKQKVVLSKDIRVPQSFNYGKFFVVRQVMDRLHTSEVLNKVLPSKPALHMKGMVLGKIMMGGSELGIYNWLRCESYCFESLGMS